MRLRVAMSGRWSYAALNPDPGKQRERGQEMACRLSVALSDHVDRFGQATSRVCTDKMCAPMGTTNSGVEATHSHQGILSSWLSHGNEEEESMLERVHGIDRHKLFSTISVLNRQGEEVQFLGGCREFGKYVEGLGPTDAVVLEASTGSFWWADQIEAKGARCFVMDPRKFRIIKDSWNKTDRQDARNLAKALWVHVVTGEFGIPTVYKPAVVVREVRRLFAQYCLLNRQIATHKNNAQAIFVENGVELKRELKKRLFAPESGLEVLKEMNISAASRRCLELTLQVLWKVAEAKERLATEILLAGEPVKPQVELLISIKGVTPLIALAFLADVAEEAENTPQRTA